MNPMQPTDLISTVLQWFHAAFLWLRGLLISGGTMLGFAYTLSQAQSGLGTLLQVNISGNSPPTWTTVGESIDITRGDMNEFDDVTNFQSLAREVMSTILNPGKWAFTANRVSSDTGQAALNTSFMNRTRLQYQIVFPVNTAAGQSSTGDTVGFYAFLEKFTPDLKVEKAIKISGSFQVTNKPTYAQGS